MTMLHVTTTPFQKTLQSLLQAIERSGKLSKEEKEKLYERIYLQIRTVTEAVLITNLPEEKLKELADRPDALNLSSYADFIIATVRDPKTQTELTESLTSLVTDIARSISPKL